MTVETAYLRRPFPPRRERGPVQAMSKEQRELERRIADVEERVARLKAAVGVQETRANAGAVNEDQASAE